MPLYTFIMDYDAGTYISQVAAPSSKSACVKWARRLDVQQVKGLGGKSHKSLIERDERRVANTSRWIVQCVVCDGAYSRQTGIDKHHSDGVEAKAPGRYRSRY
jgi:hypothetical protein